MENIFKYRLMTVIILGIIGVSMSTTNIYAVEGIPFSCATNIIRDTVESNNLGWNPDGNETSFTINEPCYFERDSIVLVNINDGGTNFESCNVDFSTNNFFEISCDNPPAEGSELHYMVLVLQKDIIGEEMANETIIPEELVERQEQKG